MDSKRIKSALLCAVRRFIVLLVAYLLGYWTWSIAWLLLVTTVLVVLKDRRKQHKIKIVAAKDKELLILKENINAMDSMLETAEWLNKVIARLWPYVAEHIGGVVKQDIETNIRAILKKYKLGGNFHFKKISLGSVPFRVNQLEVLQESPNTEIVVCADVIYDSNCDFTFSWRGAKGGMENFQVRGRVHLVVNPVASFPFIAGYNVIFPEKPAVQYKLSGVGHFLDIPGLRDIVHHIIVKRISSFTYGGSVTETDGDLAYEMLIEASGQETDESSKQNEVVTNDQLSHKHSSLTDEVTNDELSITDEIVHDQLSYFEEFNHNFEQITHSQSPTSSVRSNQLLLGKDEPQYWSSPDITTNNERPVSENGVVPSSGNVLHEQFSVSGLSNQDRFSISSENSCNKSPTVSETGHYNPIPKPSRKQTVSISEDKESAQLPV